VHKVGFTTTFGQEVIVANPRGCPRNRVLDTQSLVGFSITSGHEVIGETPAGYCPGYRVFDTRPLLHPPSISDEVAFNK
jgi:hypothetical protein